MGVERGRTFRLRYVITSPNFWSAANTSLLSDRFFGMGSPVMWTCPVMRARLGDTISEVCRFVMGKLKLIGGWGKMVDRRDRHLAESSIYILSTYSTYLRRVT
jgi:hypothetical protein